MTPEERKVAEAMERGLERQARSLCADYAGLTEQQASDRLFSDWRMRGSDCAVDWATQYLRHADRITAADSREVVDGAATLLAVAYARSTVPSVREAVDLAISRGQFAYALRVLEGFVANLSARERRLGVQLEVERPDPQDLETLRQLAAMPSLRWKRPDPRPDRPAPAPPRPLMDRLLAAVMP